MEHHKLIILGSGPAGLTAAIYAARASLNPVVITGAEEGGQLMGTTDVENWPGDATGLQGPELMDRMMEHAKHLSCSIVRDHIVAVDLSDKPFKLKGETGNYSCDSLIISTGASANWLGLESEMAYSGKGVSACATCDGFFFKDKEVAVVGGGDTAAEEAIYLSKIASKVTLVHRRDALRADKTLQSRLFALEKEGKLVFSWNKTVKEILGDEAQVTGVRLTDTQDGPDVDIQLSAVFIAIGHTPNTGIFKDQLDMVNGYLVPNRDGTTNLTATSVPGVFAAGDVMDSVYRQAITSAGTGCMAALDADRYLTEYLAQD
ncbi:thioredoxin-disulfide reductase [Candidatus Comchoanobacter bicostacola]|uniref:Thioredoxin reductase n=1 Tax=Candidatus Comchoanobacter bicostacola TaxID=2919598 RepID=A0ABY5DJH9_9GAMM|nr:thioredoxin-disulfide reductase [Candidatus Comchoanobacter bicostacola]UTC24173.1 thioredoxin-disulfide reductase [Candidatus Comchoanobacter bicostacola]